MYRVTAYRKNAILDRNLKFTHRWVKCHQSLWWTKEEAIHVVRKWTSEDWLKATIQKV